MAGNNKYLIEYKMENDAVIYIEASDARGIELVSNDDNIFSTSQRFEQALNHIKPVADALFGAFGELNNPKEVNLEFGVKFSAKAGVIFASADSEATFKVSLKWVN